MTLWCVQTRVSDKAIQRACTNVFIMLADRSDIRLELKRQNKTGLVDVSRNGKCWGIKGRAK